MNVEKTNLVDCYVITPQIFGDARGFFYESFNEKKFSEVCKATYRFVQDNHSRSAKGVLRGLHYQVKNPQGKLVRVVQGEVFDVAVDLRKASTTFGKWFGVLLSEENKKQLWIPPGFAHGFLVKSELADFVYKTTDFYNVENDRSLLWSDPTLKIEWPVEGELSLSTKDLKGSSFDAAEFYE